MNMSYVAKEKSNRKICLRKVKRKVKGEVRNFSWISAQSETKAIEVVNIGFYFLMTQHACAGQ